ncbi:hypothetical protein OGATHE_003630 [Ogataea polymorpha]|uniref:Uncharacterized protein n=1 Tax=Ogataea polymorpha TaxID=460523 RepID=A0A9P8P3Z4_9ASCO|nr:hypothetical protein OGATHE_003630 [Ogataea polymorpha]
MLASVAGGRRASSFGFVSRLKYCTPSLYRATTSRYASSSWLLLNRWLIWSTRDSSDRASSGYAVFRMPMISSTCCHGCELTPGVDPGAGDELPAGVAPVGCCASASGLVGALSPLESGRCRCEQLRNERDPVPHGHLALVRLERLGQGAAGVVQTYQPQNTAKQPARLVVLVQSGRLQVAADGVLGVRDVVALFETGVVEEAPFGPRLGQVEVELHSGGKSLVCLVWRVELGQEHALERDELSLLLRGKVHEVGVADHIQPGAQLGRVLVVALGLLAQLEERLLNLDVGQSVDLGELVDADLRHVVLSGDVRKPVDHPGDLVVAAERVRVVVAVVLLQRRNQRHVHLVDHVERVLAPRDQVVPDIDVVPDVRQPLAPRLQHALELLTLDVQVLCRRGGQTAVHLARLHELHVLLENVQQRDVRAGDSCGQRVPLAQRQLDALVAVPGHVLDCLLAVRFVLVVCVPQNMVKVKAAIEQLRSLVQPWILGQVLPVLFTHNIEEPFVKVFFQRPVQDAHQLATNACVGEFRAHKERMLHAYGQLGAGERWVLEDVDNDLVERS